LQADLDKLVLWAKRWQMEFNVDKCKVMHVGNPDSSRLAVATIWKAVSYLK